MPEGIFQKKAFVISISAVCCVLLLIMARFFLKKDSLSRQVSQMSGLAQKLQEESARLQAEKDKLAAENEKLQADSLTVISVNNDLKTEKESLRQMLQEKQKSLSLKEAELERLNGRLRKLEKEINVQRKDEQDKLFAEKKELENRLEKFEGDID